jgi:tetratricopeptide (TPR) repeat protein
LFYHNTEQALYEAHVSDSIARSIKFDEGRATSLVLQGSIYREYGLYDKAANCLQQALGIYEKSESYQQIADVYYHYGILYRVKGDVKQSFKMLFKAAEIFRFFQNNYKLNYVYQILAHSYSDIGNLSKSIEYNYRALNLIKGSNDKVSKARILHSIGIDYFDKNDYKEALNNLLLAKDLYSKTHQKNFQANILNDLSITHLELREFDKALNYESEYLKQSKQCVNKTDIQTAYLNMARIYLRMDNLDSAHYYLNLSMNEAESLHDTSASTDVLITFGEFFNAQKDYKNAIKCYNTCLTYYSKQNAYQQIKDIYSALSETYQSMGDLRTSMEYVKKYSALKDTINNQLTDGLFSSIAASEAASFERDMLQKRVTQQQIETNNIRNIIISFAAFLFLSVVVLMYNRKKSHILKMKENSLGNYAAQHQEIHESLTTDIRNTLISISIHISLITGVENKTVYNNLIKEYDILSFKLNEIIHKLRTKTHAC